MTPRAYWDSRGRLWEDHSNPRLFLLLWSPFSDAESYYLLDDKALIEEMHGPLVGVA